MNEGPRLNANPTFSAQEQVDLFARLQAGPVSQESDSTQNSTDSVVSSDTPPPIPRTPPAEPPQTPKAPGSTPDTVKAATVDAPKSAEKITRKQVREEMEQMRAQIAELKKELEAKYVALEKENIALINAFGIQYGSEAQEVLSATMEACPLTGSPEQIAENQRVINAIIKRKGVCYEKGKRISKEGVPALIQGIRNEQKLTWWQRTGFGKAILGSVSGGAAGALGSLAVFGCLAAPIVVAAAAGGGVSHLTKRRLERSNALGKGRTFLHKNPGATAAVFSIITGLGAGAHMPDGSAYMGAFVEKLADGSKEGVAKTLQLLARLRMPF